MRSARLLSIALAAALVASPLGAEGASGQRTGSGTQAAGASGPQPEPYRPEEFPQWLHDLRRAEIVAVGSFPIMFLFVQLGYNVIRYGAHDWSPEYAPLGNPNQVPYTRAETIGVIAAAASASVLVAVLDYLIGSGRARTANRADSGAGP